MCRLCGGPVRYSDVCATCAAGLDKDARLARLKRFILANKDAELRALALAARRPLARRQAAAGVGVVLASAALVYSAASALTASSGIALAAALAWGVAGAVLGRRWLNAQDAAAVAAYRPAAVVREVIGRALAKRLSALDRAASSPGSPESLTPTEASAHLPFALQPRALVALAAGALAMSLVAAWAFGALSLGGLGSRLPALFHRQDASQAYLASLETEARQCGAKVRALRQKRDADYASYVSARGAYERGGGHGGDAAGRVAGFADVLKATAGRLDREDARLDALVAQINALRVDLDRPPVTRDDYSPPEDAP